MVVDNNAYKFLNGTKKNDLMYPETAEGPQLDLRKNMIELNRTKLYDVGSIDLPSVFENMTCPCSGI